VGQPVRRVEDERFLTGRGCFVDDLQPSGTVHGFVLRSPHAHARLVSVDAEAARGMPGIRAVLTAADLAQAGLSAVPLDFPPPGHSFETWSAPLQPILAADEVRFVGDPVAFVVADELAQARDAAEAIAVEFEDRPPIMAMRDAEPLFSYEEGDAVAAASALGNAHQVVRIEVANNRIDAAPLETRGCIGAYDEASGFTLHVSTQRVQIIQRALADRVFGEPRDRVRVVAPDTGGGFGQKNGLYPEYILCLEAARRIGRPVKWIADRTDALAGDCHGRDNLFVAEAGLDRDGRILAIRAERFMNMGAYTSARAMVPVQNGLTHLTGVYAVPVARVTVQGVLTNTATTCSYRGAGRPENVFCCERLIDTIARATGRDPIALRRANLVAPAAQPWTSPLGTTFAGADFAAMLDRALDAIEHAGFGARRAISQRAGLLRGFGICLFAEDLHGSHEPIPARLHHADGQLVLTVGSGGAGHGHETSFRQILADALGLPMERFGFVQSDTAAMAEGVGTAASWSLTLAGSSVRLAADNAVEQGRAVASRLLEVGVPDLEFRDGAFRVRGTDLAAGWHDVFRAEPAFRAGGTFAGEGRSVPLGCHACEVEVDPETGAVALTGFAMSQDSGRVVNPLLVEGQLHGGAAQGIGQAWLEGIVYDGDSGQLLTGSFTDYALPRASDLPEMATRLIETPSPDNPLGVRGVGEAAATGSTPAFANAVLDALWPLGVLNLDPPLTPARVWAAIRDG
jgi:carbon-monoxide dehydrogenase large subunit